MQRSYANFAWSARTQGPHLATRLADARRRIASASNDRDGRRAIEGFLDAFGDPHVSLGDPVSAPAANAASRAQSDEPSKVARGASASSACASLRYRRRDGDFHRAIRETPGFRTIPARDFRVAEGRVNAGDGQEVAVGFVRLPHTSQHAWPDACERAWPAVARAFDDACTTRCELALWYATADTLLASLGASLEAMRGRGVSTLVLDLTGNGGGSEWADALAVTLSPGAITPNPVGMVRHPHWSERFARRVASLDSAIAATSNAEARGMLSMARQQADSLRRELARPCPLSGDPFALPPCDPLVVEPALVVDLDAARRLGIDGVLGARSSHHPRPSWRGKLIVLVDERTASAAELLTAVLADRAGAAVIGARTMGAGCGFTNGGIAYALPHSRHALRLPDCARLRASGENERAGIAATLGVPWEKGDDEGARTRKLQEALRALR